MLPCSTKASITLYSIRSSTEDTTLSSGFGSFIFIGSAIAGVLALIAGAIMKDQRVDVSEEKVQTDIPDIKLNAMKEAVLRLKELKERGAISEEEYYANLDKILGE